jgi:hypothetical protein
MSDMVNGAAYASALITNLHISAMAVLNIWQLVNVMLDTMSTNYAIWCDLMLMALTWYFLTIHILSDDSFIDNPAWARMDVVILYWLTNMLTPDLQEVI